jgi:hypothetical protein
MNSDFSPLPCICTNAELLNCHPHREFRNRLTKNIAIQRLYMAVKNWVVGLHRNQNQSNQKTLTMKHSFSIFRNISFFLFSFTLLLASCSKSKDDVVPVQGAAFVGQYLVIEPSETYTLQLESKGGSNFQIKEFGGFLNAPLNAVIDGNALKIPSQTFTNPSGKSITVTGKGVLSTKAKKDDTIKFEYKVTGFTEYESDFEGTRK